MTVTEAIKRLIRDKYLVEDLPEEKMTIESTVISGQIQQVTTFVHHEGDSGELSLGTIGEARYQVSIPEESDFRKWKIGPTIDVQVQSLRLNCKMGNLTKMIDVFELNSDEVSPLIRDSAKWYKNMDMNINIEKADMSLALSKIPQESARLSENEESPPLAQRRGPRAFQSQPLKSDPDDLSAKPH